MITAPNSTVWPPEEAVSGGSDSASASGRAAPKDKRVRGLRLAEAGTARTFPVVRKQQSGLVGAKKGGLPKGRRVVQGGKEQGPGRGSGGLCQGIASLRAGSSPPSQPPVLGIRASLDPRVSSAACTPPPEAGSEERAAEGARDSARHRDCQRARRAGWAPPSPSPEAAGGQGPAGPGGEGSGPRARRARPRPQAPAKGRSPGSDA